MTSVATPGPPRAARGPAVLAARLFGSPLNVVLTLAVAWAAWSLAAPLVRWAVLDAAVLPAEPAACRDISGACWSFVVAKSGQILFGIYPIEERWRPTLVCAVLLGLLAYSLRPAAWRPHLAALWAAALPGVLLLMFGGFAGLSYVATTMWGGLPVTLILTVTAIGGAFPLAILLALGRRADLPVIRTLCVLFIEVTRAMPLLSLLFIASIMLPLLLPEPLLPDKFFRAMIALLLFAAAYLAEVIRGGLQALPPGQAEAARALGLGYWRTQRFVVLPQALALVIPSLTNTIIVMIKNTSLVLVVGLFDLISSGRAALADPEWSSPAMETYIFIASVYFALCFGFGRFARALERRAEATP
ncbi:ABC-type amino acid transport system, permease component [Phenylobacterium zucineum HLK1]|uniref:ABC-type amino acid transport system, permease component n=1 Tax=Phenylobacterium zucineum (strain HLK1) TaxID=450851 RepID=B4R9V8_PHEZH|nr:amino acid ABC transporter permease [Phenylobacterium zucineum]ACG77872.1 ABC-type amino acid transport system, permease component [Phenylobacterium zucineum HLK1]